MSPQNSAGSLSGPAALRLAMLRSALFVSLRRKGCSMSRAAEAGMGLSFRTCSTGSAFVEGFAAVSHE
eukprot:scaffold16637_cov112-Isochrysis_galbana.AAC.1